MGQQKKSKRIYQFSLFHALNAYNRNFTSTSEMVHPIFATVFSHLLTLRGTGAVYY